MSKTRSDSVLAKLSDQQQSELYDWLIRFGYTESLRKVALPHPDGFDLQTHRHSLQRFFKRYQQQIRAEDVTIAAENRYSDTDSSLLESDAEHAIVHAGHQLATGPMTADDFAIASSWLEARKASENKHLYLQIAARQLALAEKRHAFEREKFELKVSELALQHAVALQRAAAADDQSIQERIRAAREIIYGVADFPAQPSSQS